MSEHEDRIYNTSSKIHSVEIQNKRQGGIGGVDTNKEGLLYVVKGTRVNKLIYASNKAEEEEHRPLFTIFIALVLIAIFVYQHYFYNEDEAELPFTFQQGYFQLISDYPSCVNQKYEYYRLLSYSLLHANLTHIVTNTILLLVYGISLERVHGLRIAFLYALGAIAGSLNCSMFDSYRGVVGASGAVYSLSK